MVLHNYAPIDPYGKSRYDYESRSVDAKIVVMGNTGVSYLCQPVTFYYELGHSLTDTDNTRRRCWKD